MIGFSRKKISCHVYLWIVLFLSSSTAVAQKKYSYVAQTASPVLEEGSVRAGSLTWQCSNKTCRITGPWPRPGVSACAELAKKVGRITGYGHSLKGGRYAVSLSKSQLMTCNRDAAQATAISKGNIDQTIESVQVDYDRPIVLTPREPRFVEAGQYAWMNMDGYVNQEDGTLTLRSIYSTHYFDRHNERHECLHGGDGLEIFFRTQPARRYLVQCDASFPDHPLRLSVSWNFVGDSASSSPHDFREYNIRGGTSIEYSVPTMHRSAMVDVKMWTRAFGGQNQPSTMVIRRCVVRPFR